MQIDWWTLALQAVNFLVLVWLLWRFLYRPVREVIEKRKELAEQAFTEAERHQREADAQRDRYDKARADFAEERQQLLKKMHEELGAERTKVLEEARDEADKLLEDARSTLAKEREEAVSEMRAQAAALAADMAAKILRDADCSVTNSGYRERLLKQLDSMPADEITRLKRDLAGEGARVEVVTPQGLEDEEKAQWRQRLGDKLGNGAEVAFVPDPDILGGAALRFPHSVLSLTWADQLLKAKDLLQDHDAATG